MKKALSHLIRGVRAKTTSTDFWLPSGRPYPNIAAFDPAAENLVGKSGVYVLWHLGVRPQWLRVGVSANLGATLTVRAQEPWVIAHGNNRGVYIVWALMPLEQSMGMARFLVDKLQPAFQDGDYLDEYVIDPAVAPVPCVLPPGTRE